MSDTTIATPVDPHALQAVLRPFRQGVGLPAACYTSDEILAWEREHFFEASWMCLGRSPSGDPAPNERDWRGWRFRNASEDAVAFDRHLGYLDEYLAPYEPERLVVGARHEYEIAANWKLVAENYCECYHCSQIHPELCRVTPPESSRELPHDGLYVSGPMELRPEAETMSLDGLSHGIPLRGLTGGQLREVGYVALWPNFLISPHPDYVLTHRLEPLETGRSRIECEWLFPPELAARDDFDPSWAFDFWDVTNREDWAACESLQRGASSRGFRPGPMSAFWEAGVYMWVTMVARGYLAGRVTEGTPIPREWTPLAG